MAKETKYKENGTIAIDLCCDDDDGTDASKYNNADNYAAGRVLLGRKGAGIVVLVLEVALLLLLVVR